MDQTTLVGPDIVEGRKFLELLGSSGVRVDAALWQKDDFTGRWTLLLVTPLVEELGVKGTYRRLDEILSKTLERPAVDLLDVSVFTPEARFSKSLRRDLRRVRDRHVTKQPIGDHFLEEGFIYFVR